MTRDGNAPGVQIAKADHINKECTMNPHPKSTSQRPFLALDLHKDYLVAAGETRTIH